MAAARGRVAGPGRRLPDSERKRYNPDQDKSWRKYEAPKTSVQAEDQEEQMGIERGVVTSIMIESYLAKIAETTKQKNSQDISQTARDMLDARARSMTGALVNLEKKERRQQIQSEFVDDFIRWLQGKSEYNVEYWSEQNPTHPDGEPVQRLCTPWKTQPLFHLEDVKDFFDTIQNNRTDTIKILTKLRLWGPRNINDAWIYYKYLVRGLAIDHEGFRELRQVEMDFPPPDAFDERGQPVTVIQEDPLAGIMDDRDDMSDGDDDDDDPPRINRVWDTEPYQQGPGNARRDKPYNKDDNNEDFKHQYENVARGHGAEHYQFRQLLPHQQNFIHALYRSGLPRDIVKRRIEAGEVSYDPRTGTIYFGGQEIVAQAYEGGERIVQYVQGAPVAQADMEPVKSQIEETNRLLRQMIDKEKPPPAVGPAWPQGPITAVFSEEAIQQLGEKLQQWSHGDKLDAINNNIKASQAATTNSLASIKNTLDQSETNAKNRADELKKVLTGEHGNKVFEMSQKSIDGLVKTLREKGGLLSEDTFTKSITDITDALNAKGTSIEGKIDAVERAIKNIKFNPNINVAPPDVTVNVEKPDPPVFTVPEEWRRRGDDPPQPPPQQPPPQVSTGPIEVDFGDLGEKMDRVVETLKKIPTPVDYGPRMKELTDAIKNIKFPTPNVPKTDLTPVTNAIKDLKTGLDGLPTEIEKLTKKFEDITKDRDSHEVAKAKEQNTNLTNQIDNLNEKYKLIEDKLKIKHDEFTKMVNKSKEQKTSLEETIKKEKEAREKITGDLEEKIKALGKTHKEKIQLTKKDFEQQLATVKTTMVADKEKLEQDLKTRFDDEIQKLHSQHETEKNELQTGAEQEILKLRQQVEVDYTKITRLQDELKAEERESRKTFRKVMNDYQKIERMQEMAKVEHERQLLGLKVEQQNPIIEKMGKVVDLLEQALQAPTTADKLLHKEAADTILKNIDVVAKVGDEQIQNLAANTQEAIQIAETEEMYDELLDGPSMPLADESIETNTGLKVGLIRGILKGHDMRSVLQKLGNDEMALLQQNTTMTDEQKQNRMNTFEQLARINRLTMTRDVGSLEAMFKQLQMNPAAFDGELAAYDKLYDSVMGDVAAKDEGRRVSAEIYRLKAIMAKHSNDVTKIVPEFMGGAHVAGFGVDDVYNRLNNGVSTFNEEVAMLYEKMSAYQLTSNAQDHASTLGAMVNIESAYKKMLQTKMAENGGNKLPHTSSVFSPDYRNTETVQTMLTKSTDFNPLALLLGMKESAGGDDDLNFQDIVQFKGMLGAVNGIAMEHHNSIQQEINANMREYSGVGPASERLMVPKTRLPRITSSADPNAVINTVHRDVLLKEMLDVLDPGTEEKNDMYARVRNLADQRNGEPYDMTQATPAIALLGLQLAYAARNGPHDDARKKLYGEAMGPFLNTVDDADDAYFALFAAYNAMGSDDMYKSMHAKAVARGIVSQHTPVQYHNDIHKSAVQDALDTAVLGDEIMPLPGPKSTILLDTANPDEMLKHGMEYAHMNLKAYTQSEEPSVDWMFAATASALVSKPSQSEAVHAHIKNQVTEGIKGDLRRALNESQTKKAPEPVTKGGDGNASVSDFRRVLREDELYEALGATGRRSAGRTGASIRIRPGDYMTFDEAVEAHDMQRVIDSIARKEGASVEDVADELGDYVIAGLGKHRPDILAKNMYVHEFPVEEQKKIQTIAKNTKLQKKAEAVFSGKGNAFKNSVALLNALMYQKTPVGNKRRLISHKATRMASRMAV